ncbi:MAG: tandem-95 repeat protein, partial [Cytophagia bacterium]|nr:tandem-95 repeat protein [Cytophagia bacterium]
MRKVFTSVLLLYAAIFHSNQAPVFTSTPITQINDNETYTYKVEVEDTDGDLTSVGATELPDWLTAEPEFEVSTLAGGISPYFNNGDVLEAGYYEPRGMAFDGNGNLFIADSKNHVIRKITPEGVVSSFAGAGYAGFADGIGVEALFDMPEDIAFDLEGNLLVADRRNHAIRRISPNGEVTTLAGDGIKGSADGALSEARFSSPQDLAVDSQGRVYINDTGNLKIRVLTTSNMVNTFIERNFDLTIDGSTVYTSLSGVHSIAIDTHDHLHVGFAYSKIFKVDDYGNAVLLAGGGASGYLDGSGTDALLNRPTGLTFSSNGDLYFSDANNHRIRKVTPNGNVTTVAGAGGYGDTYGPALSSKLLGARDLVFDESGNLFFSDGENYIKKFNTSGDIELFSGRSQSYTTSLDGDGRDAILKFPAALAVNTEGEIYFSERGAIRVLTLDGTVTTKSTNITGQLPDMVFGSDDVLYFIESHSVKKMTQDGVISSLAGDTQSGFVDGEGSDARFNFPNSIDIDSNGDLIIADMNNHRIRKVTTNGHVTTIAGSSEGFNNGSIEEALFIQPMNLVVDKSDNIFVYDYGNQRIRKISSDGSVTTLAGNGYNGYNDGIGESASFSYVSKMVIDESNNLWMFDGTVFRRVDQNGSVKSFNKLSPFGSKDGMISDASFGLAMGLAYSNRRFFMTDDQARSIRQVAPIGLTLTGDPNGKQGIHQVKLLADDGFGGTSNQDFSIEVLEVTPPVFTSATAVSIEEDTEGVFYTATATAMSQVTYSLGSEGDNSSFEINPQTGELQMTIIPDYENPLDASSDNIYEIEVIATDESNISSSLIVNITVTDVNENVAPVFTSTPITQINDNEIYTYTVEVEDADGDLTSVSATELPDWLTAKPGFEVSTLAGGKSPYFKDGDISEAMYDQPRGLAFDQSGNLYIADSWHHMIRKITPDGTASIFAGTGYAGFSDGSASEATFNFPQDVAFDLEGNLLVADYRNHAIRSISPDGEVSTLAGNGLEGGDHGSIEQTQFSFPLDIAVNSEGYIFINDTGNFQIKVIYPSRRTVRTHFDSPFPIRKNGVTEEMLPLLNVNGLAVDADDNLYFGRSNGTIVKYFNNQTGDIEIFAGNGMPGYLDGNGTDAQLSGVTGLTFAENGDLYFSDANNYRIRKISPNRDVSTVAGSGSYGNSYGEALNSNIEGAMDLTFDGSGNLFFTDGQSRIKKLTTEGNLEYYSGRPQQFATSEDGKGRDAVLNFARAMAVNSNGEIYFTESGGLRKLTLDGKLVTLTNENVGIVNDMIFDSNDVLYFVESATHSVRKMGLDGVISIIAGGQGSGFSDGFGSEAKFQYLYGITIDANGDLLVSDRDNNRIRKVTPEGQVTTLAGSIAGYNNGGLNEALFNGPQDLVTDEDGNIYVYDWGNFRVRKISTDGQVSTFVGSGNQELKDGEGELASFVFADEMVIDESNNLWMFDGRVFRQVTSEGIVKSYNENEEQGDRDGTLTNARFGQIEGLAYSNGRFFVTDVQARSIRQITTSSLTLEGDPIDKVGFHQVRLSADDGLSEVSNQDFTIEVIDIPQPIITSEPIVSVDENSVSVYKVTSTGASSILYSLGSGKDETLFSINSNTGELSFNSSPDFENPQDLNGDNVYEVLAIASQDELADQLLVRITVNNLNDESPVIASIPGETVNDNDSYEYNIIGFDPDGSQLTTTAETIPDWLELSTAPFGQVTTFAGTVSSLIKDGPGASASYNNPYGTAFDKEGNLYIADTGNNRIVKVSPDGVASTYVGTGVAGNAGGYREQALLNQPTDVAFDAEGNMYISDNGSSTVRKVNLEGEVSTLIGFERGISTDTYTLGNHERLNDVVINSQGLVYLASNNGIRVISPSGEIENFIRNGNGYSSISDGLGIDANDNVYFSDPAASQIKVISPEGSVSVFAGLGQPGYLDGEASQAKFENPAGLAYHPDGSILVSDAYYKIRKIDAQGNVTTIVNDIRDFSSSVILHLDVSSQGQIIALDFLQAEVFKVTGSGSLEFFSGGYDRSPKNGPKEESTFNLPTDAVQDAEGNIYVSESHRIRKIDKDGIVTTFAGGTFGFVDGVASEAKFSFPSGLAIDDLGNLYVADRGNNAIRKIEPNGTVSTIAGNGNWGFKDGEALSAEFRSPLDLALDDEGNIYVTDQGNNRIRKISPERIVSTLAGDGTNNLNPDDLNDPNIPAPSSITLDNQGNIYFTVARSLIRRIGSDGSTLTIAGNTLSGGISDGVGTAAKFQNPLGLITDDSGNIYVADNEFNAVRKISPEGLVTTLAGAQTPGLEDKTGSQARFRGPSGLLLNSEGNLIVVDNGNHRLRELSLGNSLLSGSAVGQKGTHPVVLKITDESGASTTQSFDIEVIDVTAPVFTSPTEVEVEENTIESFFQVEATDSNQLEYSLGTEKDESLFNLDAQTGELSFLSLPNFESPQDADQDNVYEILVLASDGRNTSEQSIRITVKDLDEVGPVVTLSSNSQGLVFTPSVTVNVSLSEEVIGLSAQLFTVTNATISNFQGNGLAYSFVLTSLADGPASVKVLENKVFDAAQNGNEASNVLSFNFEARNVAPTGITLSASAVSENITERVEVAVLGAEDGDEADQHTFRLVSGNGDTDNAKFNIIGNKLFKRNEVSLDFETQPTLSVRIQVSDIRGGLFTAVKTINVIDLPEPSMSLKIVDATERELEVAGVNFGRVKVGASQVRQVEVLNTSTDAELLVTEIKLTSGFTVSESIFTLGIGEKKVLNVTYLPQEPGVHLGKLELVTNAGNQSLSVAGSAFANKKPIAIAPEARISHIPGNILKLIGFDPDGDEIEFVITANPALGVLEAQSGLGEYKFIPSGLAPETVYEDELKFKVVEKNGGLSSNEATLKFRFRIRDVKHSLLPTEIVSVDSDNINIVVSFTDEVINNDYYLTGFYRGKEEGQTVFFGNNLIISKGDLTNTNGVLSAQVSLSRNDFPALFTNSKLLLAVKLKTANGFESSNTRIFTRSNEGQLNGNAVSDGSTDDGGFSVFALDSTVPENESIDINISAVEFGDFDFSGASLQITKSPANGTLGQPVLVSKQNGLAQWTVSYTSTTEIGIEDSFEFSVVHPVRNETLTGIAKIEVIGVPDAPELSAIADQQVNEDETLSFSIEALDVDSELSYSVISSESDILGTVSDGKLNITATNNFNGSAVIQLVVSEANETSPQSVSQSFNLTVLPVNDAPVVTAMADQKVNEDGEIIVALAASDLDGDAGAFSYSVTSNSGANITYSVENGSLKVKPAADYNGVVNFTVKANDGSGTATAISAGESFKLTIVPVNDVPEVSKAISTQTLIEGFISYNLDLSKYFSDKETASSELVYSISNLTNVATSVNGKLLAISSVNGNTGLQTATVTASDGELSVTQQITFVTSAPSADVTIANAISDLNLAEDFGQQTVDLSNVFAYSLNANASFTFSLAGNQNVDALINGNNLEINSTENFNGTDVIYITATVDGKSNLTSFNINISPVNDAPTLVATLSDESVLEDATFTKAISSSTFADIDGDALSYSASYNAAWLSFDAATRTFSGTPENGDVGTVEVTVTAEDPSGAKATDVFQITVSNTNDNPTNIGISALAFDENISVGTVVASLSGTDPDVGDTNFTYSLVSGTGDTDNASFQIVDGQLKTLSSINYEAKNSYSIRVKITDGFEGTFEKVFTISVNNVNEVATDIILATSSIAESQAVGAVIDGFATVDPDQGDTYSYRLVAGTGDTDNASFDIVSGQLVSKAEFNFEEKSSYSVRVKSTDAGGLSFEKAFTITVTDANDAPTAITSTTLELAENSAIGTVIGEFSSTDEDTSDAHTYSLVSGTGDTDNASFEFDGANLNAKASFNFETKSSYSIRVQSSDGNGGTLESQFTVNVTNVLEVELRTESSITVPTIGMGETETVELILNNDGEDGLEISSITFPEGYSGSFTKASIIGGGNETLTITFEPTEAGTYAGDITITSNAGANTVSITGEAEVVAGIEDPTILPSQVKLYP